MKPDIIIIGSGMGGATVAASLAPSGKQILILERGLRLSPSSSDRCAKAIFTDGVYRPDETWLDGQGRSFNPGNYYNVGGNSKFYGAVLIRYRAEDFKPLRHSGGSTPGWPISYEDLEPDYQAAENLYQVRGELNDDPTEPVHSGVYPHPPVADEEDIAELRIRLRRTGLTPSSLPLGVDINTWLAGGRTTWDAYPDTRGGKMDAETCALASALAHENVTLKTDCLVTRLHCDETGRVTDLEYNTGGQLQQMSAPVIVLAAGAVQSAALLLTSKNDHFPNGLANRSDQVGRNFMNHNCSAVLAVHPLRRNRAIYQKTIMLNDFYLARDDLPPLGNVQMLGKITGEILSASSPLPRWLAGWIAARSFDFYAMSEDLPNPHSRVTVNQGRITLDWQRSNWDAHVRLVDQLKKALKRAGFPIVLSKPFDRRTPSHQCGTARMGHDPQYSVVDSYCRSHDHNNLFIVDASVLPTSAAVNPALTIAALALRTGRYIRERQWSQ